MKGRVTVMLCCNRYQDGSFRGKVEKIDVCPSPSDVSAELEGTEMAIRFCPDASVALGGKRFSIWSHREWVGNWCWDAVSMDDAVACRLLEYLRGRGWDLLGGYETLYRPWHDGTPLEPAMLYGEENAAEEGALT